MSLIFTDAQVKDLTQDVLDSPVLIAQADANIASATLNKSNKLTEDNENAVYTGNWINIINQYHAEIKYLSGVLYTDYNPANIDPAGQLLDGNIHFLTSPIWVKFQPKVHDSNNGLPTSVFADTETEAITRANTQLTLLKTGFADGGTSDTTVTSFTGSIIEVNNGGFSTSQRVLFISGSNFLFGTITAVASTPVTTGLQLLTVSIISSSAGFGGISNGASVTNFHPGFNFSARESGAGANAGDSAYMASLKITVDTSIADWKTRLQAEMTALNLNDAVGTEKTQINAAKSQVTGYVTTITTWQGFPTIGAGTSRFGTNLPALETALAARPGQFAARISEITTALGSVAQAGDGSYSGTGHYFDLFDNLNIRLNKAGGTLRGFYDADLGVILFTQQKINIQNKTTRDSTTFTIRTFASNAVGTNVVTLTSVTGLTVGDSVKMMSKTQAVLTATISAIVGLNVTLSITVPNLYKASESARVVGQT